MRRTEPLIKSVIKLGLFLVPFLPLLVTDSLFFPFITGKNFVFRIIIEVLLVLWIFLTVKHREYLPKKSVILWAVVGFFVVLALATVFGINPTKSFWGNAERMEGLFGLLHLFAFFIITTSIFSKKDWIQFLFVSIGASIIVVFHALFQALGWATPHGGLRVDANLGNSSYLAIYNIFHIFFALYLITRYRLRQYVLFPSQKKLLIWLLSITAVLHVVVLYFTSTRGAILGLLGGFLLFGIIIAAFSKNRRTKQWGAAVILVMILIPMLFLLVKDSSLVNETPILKRFARISIYDHTTKSRLLIWELAFEGWKERPILGWGPDNFTTLFTQFYNPKLWNQETWFDRAHNVFFDWLTAAGILGLITYLSLFVVSVVTIWRLWRQKVFSVVQMALFLGLLAAYFVHNLVVFDNLISYILFFMVLGYLHGHLTHLPQSERLGTSTESESSLHQWYVGIALLVTVGALFSIYSYNIKPSQASRDIVQGLRFLDNSQTSPTEATQKGIGELLEAISRRTFLTTEAREILARNAQDIVSTPEIELQTRVEIINAAIAEMEDQVERFPLDMRARMFMISLYDVWGEYDKAQAVAEETIKLAPNRQLYRFLYGIVLIHQNQIAKATEQFEIAIQMDPTYPDAVEYYALSLLYEGDGSLANDVIEGRYIEKFLKDEEFLKSFPVQEDLDYIVFRLSNLDQRFARSFAAIGNYEAAALVYEKLILTEAEEGRLAPAEYFVQYALLSIESVGELETIERLRVLQDIFPELAPDIEGLIGEVRDRL